MSRRMTSEAVTGQYETCMRHGNDGKLRGCVVLGGIGLLSAAAAFEDKKAAGAELFATRGCAHCHGEDGTGTEKGPSLRDVRKKLSASQVSDQIVHGGQGMPAFGDSLKADEVEDLVSFLRAKKWVAPPAVVHPVEAKPAEASPGL